MNSTLFSFRTGDKPSIKQLMAEYLPFASKASYFCFGVSLVMLLDFCLPSLEKNETVNSVTTEVRAYAKRGGQQRTIWQVIHTVRGTNFNLPEGNETVFLRGDHVKIFSSRLLRVPLKIEKGYESIHIHKSIYGNFIFAPLMLLVLSGLGVLARNDPNYGFNFGITSLTILVFLIVIVLLI